MGLINSYWYFFHKKNPNYSLIVARSNHTQNILWTISGIAFLGSIALVVLSFASVFTGILAAIILVVVVEPFLNGFLL